GASTDFDSCQRTNYQRAAQGSNRSTPVAVGPIAEGRKPYRRHQSAQECPTRRHPRLQSPTNRCTHEPGAQPDAPKGMTHYDLSEGKKKSVSRVVHRAVRRSPILLESFKVLPHRVCRVC